MKSHEYQFRWQDLAGLGAAPLVPVVMVPLLLHVLLDFFPSPRHLFDVERTIITHQAEACMKRQDADVVLLGDSSGLMGVDTVAVGEQVGLEVLNLGTISFLSLREYSEMLELYVRNNPDGLKAAVLFLHPEALRRVASEPYYVSFLHSVFEGVDHRFETRPYERLVGLLGLDIFRGRVWGRLVPPALNGQYGQMYGFTADMDRYMTLNQGCLIDPTRVRFRGNPEYRLAATLEKASGRFRSLLPPGVLLGVGVTPTPEEFVHPDHEKVYQELLRGWGEWTEADLVLTNLPATMPGRYFSTVTHLSAEGRQVYSRWVADEFRKAFTGSAGTVPVEAESRE